MKYSKAVITTELANEFLFLKAKIDKENRFWKLLISIGFHIKSFDKMYTICHKSLPLKTSFFINSDDMTITRMTIDKASWLYKENGSPIMTCEEFVNYQKEIINKKVLEVLENINKVMF